MSDLINPGEAEIPAVRHRQYAQQVRDDIARSLTFYPPEPNFVDRLAKMHLDAAIRDFDAVLAGKCPEDPARLAGAPLGQYHCPACGCMLVAGMSWHPHQDCCYFGLGADDEPGPEDVAPDGSWNSMATDSDDPFGIRHDS